MIAEEAYVLSKSFTNNSIKGITGALAGKNCTIKSTTKADGVTIVVFAWTADDGTEKTTTIQVNDGAKGDKGDKGEQGYTPQKNVDYFDGVSPTATVEKVGKVTTITITDKNGTTTATIKDGEGSEGGEANVIDSISVNGVNVPVDDNKNVDITVPTKTSDLSNDSNYQTADDVTVALAPYAKSADVSTEIITEIAKVVADAPEDLNTLKEMSDWIAGHENDASAMNSAIQKNKTDISALQTDKADASDLTAHTDDADIHVTTENKTLWNTVEGKVDKTSIVTALDDTVTDEQVASALLAKTELDKKIDKTSIATTLSAESTDDEVVGALTTYNELQKLESANKEQFATASGDYITVNDSVNGNIVDLKLYGKSEQKQYSGKNLLNATLETSTSNGVTCTANGDGTYTLNGTASVDTTFYLLPKDGTKHISNGTYCITGCLGGSNTSYYIQYQGRDEGDTDNTISSRCMNGTTAPFEITEDTKQDFVIVRVISGTICNNIVIKPMIVDASVYPDATYDDFEPYVGGIPSPNPNYPQEIKSVVNPVVKVVGKNLLNPTLDTTTKNGVTCTKNDDGTYTLNGTASANTFININTNISVEIGNTYNLIGFNGDINIGKEHSIQYVVRDKNEPENIFTYSDGVFVPNVSNVISYVFIMKGITLNNVLFKPMLTTDLSATYDDFVPYQGEQTATIPYTLNAIPVESGGNVTIDGQEYIADYVDFENKKLVRMVEEITVENVSFVGATDTNTYYVGKSVDKKPFNNNNISIALSNMFKGTSFNNRVSNENSKKVYVQNGDNIIFRAENNTSVDWSTVTLANQWFAQHKPSVSYALATPTTIDLTDEQVQAFKELQTYYPTTNVFVTSDQLNGYAEIKYPTTDVSGLASRNESRITDIEGTVGSTDISAIGDGTITNAISMMSSKLGGLTFSASGTTLSITDGTNTWTLEANS